MGCMNKKLAANKKLSFLILLLAALLSLSCQGEEGEGAIAVFVPGVLEGSPSYEAMDLGVREAAGKDFNVRTIEGGFDQASWYDSVLSLASEGNSGLIVTSNPAMSEICASVARLFPNQAFLVLDGSGLGGERVVDVVYRHIEQAFVIGYFAGLVTISDELEHSNPDLKVGMIVGQEYPQMMREILPGYEAGLQTVNPDIELEFRVIGNWYDAEQARELAEGLYDRGVDVVLTIAGGANQGVISAAKSSRGYVLWFDAEGSSLAPGIVLASSVLRQENLARMLVQDWIDGELTPGASMRVGFSEGYIDFPTENRHFRKFVPKSIQEEMRRQVEKLKRGEIDLSALHE